MMREFITDKIHWQLCGDAPCGAVPYPKLGKGTTFFGWRPPPIPLLPQWCETCAAKRALYMQLLRNGGYMSGWDIQPNPDRHEAQDQDQR
jgi:hypothetical protein